MSYMKHEPQGKNIPNTFYDTGLTRRPLGLRATRQPLGGGGIKLPPLLLRRYRRNAKR